MCRFVFCYMQLEPGTPHNMKLLHPDHKATDTLYHKLQENCPVVELYQPICPGLNLCPILLRDRVEELYKPRVNLLDRNFRSRIKHDFPACYSELYFCATFQERLGLRVEHPSDKGPDFYLPDLDCWAEVVTVSSGEKDSPNSIQQPSYDGKTAYSHPKDQIILRITSNFTDKAMKIFEYIEKGLIKDSQRVIICISGGWIGFWRIPMYGVGGFPDVVSALLPIGQMVLNMNKKDMSFTGRTFEYRDHVPKVKRTGAEQPIGTDYFLDPKYSSISAVIYSWADVRHSIEAPDLGSDFFIVHNPLATNPLPLGSIKCGIEYEVEVESDSLNITPIEHESER